ncbi:MAG: ribosomal-protein-alanine N-acetyltransferase [Desulfuromonadales bacterium]|nr:MAG: ribosomal-protein-alanine N-acetyltransferase [Desulfuromonadales bacterium]
MDVPAVAIRPMTENDLDPVMAIELDSFSRPWTRDHFTAELDSSRSFPFVACTNDGAIAGYICPTLVLDEGEILDVAVRRDCRGAGIGVKLVARAIAYLAERGATVVLLEVRVSNESAISLYRRFGFKESGRRKGYYENGEDAILMYYTIDDSEGRADAV